MTSDQSTFRTIPRREFIKQVGYAAATAAAISPTLAAFGQANDQPLSVALVGCAHIHTPGYVKLLKGRKDVTVKYVWDHERARAEKNAAELPGSQVVDDLKTIWSDPAVTGVVILSETIRHHDLVMAATAANKHLYVEKPMGITGKDSRAMAEAIENANRLFTTGYFMRTQPVHIFLREQIASGKFGQITRARGSNCHNGSLGHWFDTDWRWMADPKLAGVGAFGDLGTHSLDILMWLLGDVAAITADIKVVTGHYDDCDESGEALFKFKNGVTGTLAAGWVDVENPVSLLISGTEGHACIIRNDLFFKCKNVPGADGKQPWCDLPSGPPPPLDQFLNALAGKPDMPLVTPREAAARVIVMEAAYQAAHRQQWVEVAA